MLNHQYIGTEHLLLGLIHEGEGVAAAVLDSLGIDLEDVRQQIEEIIGVGQRTPTGHIPFTPRAKKVLELSLREAFQLGHNYIGTEHLLLGLIREGEGVAAQILFRLGADLNRVRQAVIQLLHGYKPRGREIADLTSSAAAGRLKPVIGREREIEQVIAVLAADPPGNPLLVGERGVGVSAVVRGVAQAMIGPSAPSRLASKHIYEIDLATRPDDGLREVIAATRSAANIVLFVEHSRTMDERIGLPAIDLLRPFLIGSELQIIAMATPAEQPSGLSPGDGFTTSSSRSLSTNFPRESASRYWPRSKTSTKRGTRSPSPTRPSRPP